MKNKTSVTILSIVVILSACGDKKVTAPVSVSNEQQKIAASVEKVAFDAAFKSCGQLGQSTKVVVVDLDGLHRAQEMIGCSESYLQEYPEGKNVEEAEQLRYNAAVASMGILNQLEKDASTPAGSGDTAASAQAKLVSREQVTKSAVQNSYLIRRAVHYQTVRIFREVFQQLSAEGFKMGNAEAWQQAANERYKSQGIWELPVLAKYSNGAFVSVTQTIDRAAAPLFLVEGYGPVEPVTMIRDENFDSSGVFGDKCDVSVSSDEASFSVPCGEYLSGERAFELVKRVKSGIEESVKAKAQDNAVLNK